jgi:hypothetical protein
MRCTGSQRLTSCSFSQGDPPPSSPFGKLGTLNASILSLWQSIDVLSSAIFDISGGRPRLPCPNVFKKEDPRYPPRSERWKDHQRCQLVSLIRSILLRLVFSPSEANTAANTVHAIDIVPQLCGPVRRGRSGSQDVVLGSGLYREYVGDVQEGQRYVHNSSILTFTSFTSDTRTVS